MHAYKNLNPVFFFYYGKQNRQTFVYVFLIFPLYFPQYSVEVLFFPFHDNPTLFCTGLTTEFLPWAAKKKCPNQKQKLTSTFISIQQLLKINLHRCWKKLRDRWYFLTTWDVFIRFHWSVFQLGLKMFTFCATCSVPCFHCKQSVTLYSIHYISYTYIIYR